LKAQPGELAGRIGASLDRATEHECARKVFGGRPGGAARIQTC
jgi:hypothetical protein